MLISYSYSVILWIWILLCVQAQDLQVCLKDMGCVKGITMPGLEGHDSFEAFLGIPYAKPPIGMLRLKNPEPVEPWSPIVLDATKTKEDCIQKNYFFPGFPIWGSEDCLYINLYRPKVTSTSKLPVIFYIHGGGFFSGGANPRYLGPEYFMANQGAILVFAYYRLGPFGFLSTNDTNMPGNFGLKDQNMALRWVQRHIATFGGDPQLVTIMGHSAGGGSVDYQLLSPASVGLFHRAIIISGNSLSAFAAPLANPERQVRTIAAAAGIENVHKYCTKSLTKALQEMNANTILNAGDALKVVHNLPLANFRPVVEQPDWTDAFLAEQPAAKMQRGDYSKVPTLLGTISSQGEGAVVALSITEMDTLRSQFNANFDEYLMQTLDYPTTKSTDELRRDVNRLVEEYMNGVHEINSETSAGFNELFGDINFVYPLYEYLQLTLEKRAPTYLYQFDYRGKYSLSTMFGGNDRDVGVVHYDDYLYIFNSPIIYPVLENVTAATLNLIHDYVREFVEFARTGVPPSFADVGMCTAESFQSRTAAGNGICNYLLYTKQPDSDDHTKITANDFNIKRMQLLAQTIGKR